MEQLTGEVNNVIGSELGEVELGGSGKTKLGSANCKKEASNGICKLAIEFGIHFWKLEVQ